MYLANDVIQNSKKKGPEYGKEFGKCLEKIFTHIGETCSADDKTLKSLGRILNIWEERGVYDGKHIKEFRVLLNKNSEEENTPNENNSNKTEKRKSTDNSSRQQNDSNNSNKKHKSSSSSSTSSSGQHRDRIKSETIEVNGTVETHVILSPRTPAGIFMNKN